MSTILFAERTSSSPHTYVCVRNSGVRPLDLAYVRPQRSSVWLLFSRGLRLCWVNTKDLGPCFKNNSIENLICRFCEKVFK